MVTNLIFTGATITEIGIAQQRLFDDDTSNVGQPLPSTATFYPSEISQPGPFPTMQTFQYQQVADPNGKSFEFAKIPHNALYEPTQLLHQQPPVPGFSTPAASKNVDSPQDASEFSPSAQLAENLGENLPQKPAYQTKSIQSAIFSPHDTEPFSSVTSPHEDKSKNESATSGMISPQKSPGSTHDELAMPSVAVAIPSAKKKRGRPKKQPQYEDEDDELALGQDLDADPAAKPVDKRRPGRPRKSTGPSVTDDSSGETTASEIPAGKQLIVKLLIPPPATDKIDSNDGIKKQKEPKKEPKKKKTKRAKAVEEAGATGTDDDVMWVDPKPIEAVEANHEHETPKSGAEPSIPSETLLPHPVTSTNDKTEANQPAEKPAPKKRGRKRKKADEVLKDASPAQVDKNAETIATLSATETGENTAEDTAGDISDINAGKDDMDTAKGDQENQVPIASDKGDTSKAQPDKPPQTPSASLQKGSAKPSPMSSTGKVPYRVGLSKRARIAPLLKIVRK